VSEIIISGSLESVKTQALAVSKVVQIRAAEGWPAFQSDEVWIYKTEMDNRVCPICAAWGREKTFSGDKIPIFFPDYDLDARNFIVYPRVHAHDPARFFNAPCRCKMTWQNPLECLERRLHKEKMSVIL